MNSQLGGVKKSFSEVLGPLEVVRAASRGVLEVIGLFSVGKSFEEAFLKKQGLLSMIRDV